MDEKELVQAREAVDEIRRELLEDGDGDLQTGKTRRRRRSSKGSEVQTAPEERPTPITPEIVAPVVALPFDIWSLRSGHDQMALSPSERSGLSEITSHTLTAWMPTADGKWVALALCALTFAGVIGEKLVLARALREREKDTSGG